MYKALTSFCTKDYDVRKNEILDENFTTAEEIQDLLNIGYIKVDDGIVEITQNGTYDIEEYDTAEINVEASDGVTNLVDEINGEVI